MCFVSDGFLPQSAYGVCCELGEGRGPAEQEWKKSVLKSRYHEAGELKRAEKAIIRVRRV